MGDVVQYSESTNIDRTGNSPVDHHQIVTFALFARINHHEALICTALAECHILFNDTLIMMACVFVELEGRAWLVEACK